MASPPVKPLLTFAIAAFNQERFVREAVEAAFAQTYSPLEIILSDDNSKDRTFEIMQEMAAAYRGPHKLILNRNPVGRCIGGHINRIVEISHGEFIVGAAGDDVSLPRRTERIYEVWEQSGRKATSIHSDFVQIDEVGNILEQRYKLIKCPAGEPLLEQRGIPSDYVKTLEPVVFGCSHAFGRSLFKIFGDLPESLIHEDNVLGFRSLMAGKVLYINEPLVKYRLHGDNVYLAATKSAADLQSIDRDEDRIGKLFRNRENMYRALLLDLETAKQRGLVDKVEFEKAIAEARKIHRCFSLRVDFLDSGFVSKCGILYQLRRLGLAKDEMNMVVKRLIPRPILVRLRLAVGYIGTAIRRQRGCA